MIWGSEVERCWREVDDRCHRRCKDDCWYDMLMLEGVMDMLDVLRYGDRNVESVLTTDWL